MVLSKFGGASSTPSKRMRHLPFFSVSSSHSFVNILVDMSPAQLMASSRSQSAVGEGAPTRLTSRKGTKMGKRKSTLIPGDAKCPEYTKAKYFMSVVLPEPGAPRTTSFL